MNSFAAQYAETLHKTCDMSVIITDRDAVIACAGVPKKDYIEKKLSADLEKITDNRTFYRYDTGDRKLSAIDDASGKHFISCAMPILSEGDIIGCVASVLDESDNGENRNAELEIKLIQTAASFLGKQLE